MMELFLRGWSVLQVVAIVICIQRNVLSERVQGCVESQLNLRCPEMKVIKVTAVVLGDSNCRGTSCCITDSDCTRNANANHRAYVNSRCDNKESCTVAVLREKIPCGYWGVRYNNDFERITYICIDAPQRSTTARVSRPASTVHMLRTSERKTENGSTTARVSRPASTVHMLRTSERKIEYGSTTSTYSRPASTVHIFRTSERKTEYGSTTAAFSRPASTVHILRTSERKTEYVEASISTDVQSTEGSDQTINGHDNNVTHEDRLYTWSTAATLSTPDSNEDILSTKNNPTEKETDNGATTSATDVQTSEAPDQNGGEHGERGTHEDPSDNSCDTTTSTDSPNDQVSDGHNENVTHEDNTQRVQGCVGSQLSLRCPETKIIKVTAVVLGDSACRGASCCIKDSDCTRNANANHRTDVNSRCDKKESCTVAVLREKIPCGYWGVWYNNDFERITYICIDDPQSATTSPTDVQTSEGPDQNGGEHGERGTHEDPSDNSWSATATFSRPDSTENIFRTEEEHPVEEETENGDTTTSTDSPNDQVSDRYVDGHNENVIHEDNTQRVQGCVGSQLSLRCPETKVIKVTALVLGDSACRGTSCCIKDSDCTRTANSIQIADVRSRCDNKQSCTVGVLQAKIPCGYLGLRMNNDFEQITYICNVQSDTTTSTDSPNDQGSDRYVDGYDENVTQEDNTHDATTSSDEEKREGSRDKHGPNEKQPYNSYNTTSSIAAKAAAEVKNKALQDQNINGRHEKRVHDEHSGNSWFVPVVMPTVCILVLIAIVAAVAMMRRKRWAKGSGAVELTEINGTIRNGEIHANEKQTMVSLNNGNESSNHGNDMMKNSRDTGATASETCEIPDNVFGSFADGAGSRPTEDPTLFKSRDYQPISYQDQHQTFAA